MLLLLFSGAVPDGKNGKAKVLELSLQHCSHRDSKAGTQARAVLYL